MRLLFITLIVLLLVGCTFQSEQGQGLVGFKKQAEDQIGITGQVISDVYNERVCLEETDCGPSQVCVNQTCKPKN